MSSTVQVVGKLMEWSGQALQRADIAAFITERAQALVEKEAAEGAFSWTERILHKKSKIAERHISNEFSSIYKHATFNRFMAQQLSQFDEQILVRLVKRIEEYTGISEERFYALPKFLVSELFEIFLKNSLSSAKGLPQVFDDVFGKEAGELRNEKILMFIEFASREATRSAIDALDKISQPSVTGIFRKALNIKSFGPRAYLWGHNASMTWKEGGDRGHYYFDKRDEKPMPDVLAEVETLKNRLETLLLNSGTRELAPRLEETIVKGRIPNEIRKCISVEYEQPAS
jgi:hypothetical protein